MTQAYNSDLNGFISNEISSKALVAAVRLVECDKRYFPPRMAELKPEAKGSITERERLVLKQLLAGSTNKVIALSLGIDETAVASTLKAFGLKLGARKRTEITLRARRSPNRSLTGIREHVRGCN